MSDIYLHLNGQQTGPYQPAQLRQMLAEGKIPAGTPAWHQGLSEWSTVENVLAAFPNSSGPPPYVPPAVALTVPVKKGMSGCVIAAIIVGAVSFFGIFVLSVLAGIALGPIQNGIKKAKENASMQSARAIGIAMFAYANDHNGTYPDGKTSTEVFQVLIDGKYISDPAIFYIAMPGKIKPTSDKLTAGNVCYDVTSGASTDSPDGLPLVFTTGYTLTYSAGASATRDSPSSSPFPGLAVCYKNNNARFWATLPDGTSPPIISANFDPGSKTYQQLRP
jgi:type II secretory pathway pseudopilin PulG